MREMLLVCCSAASGTRLCRAGAAVPAPAPSTRGVATGTVSCWSPGLADGHPEHPECTPGWRGTLVFSPGGLFPVAEGVAVRCWA